MNGENTVMSNQKNWQPTTIKEYIMTPLCYRTLYYIHVVHGFETQTATNNIYYMTYTVL